MTDTRTQEFLEYVQAGGQVEATDWMPDEYRSKLVKFIEMHGNSELMGVLPERDWILRAPTLQRKLALTAKIQDEVGHAQLIYRVVEDLGKPREQSLEDLISGKSKFHNVFHYPTKTWGDVGVIAWLVDAAAIISQKALLKCSYAPYARIMKKICWEESFHILHGRDVILAMVTGTPEQRELVQEALVRWWPPLMMFHGNPIQAENDPMFHWRIKSQGNEEARQQFLDGYVPQIRELGLEIPDPKLAKDEETGVWAYTEPDWDELKHVVTGHGPMTAERLEFRRMSRDETAWVRDVVLAQAALIWVFGPRAPMISANWECPMDRHRNRNRRSKVNGSTSIPSRSSASGPWTARSAQPSETSRVSGSAAWSGSRFDAFTTRR